MTEFSETIADALGRHTLILLTLSKRNRAVDHPAERISVRPTKVGSDIQFQFTSERDGKHTHQNLPAEEARLSIDESFGTAFRHCHLFTTEADFAARAGKSGVVRVSRSAPTKRRATADHNRQKQYVIPENQPCPFLTEIGVMTHAGKVKANKQRKFRQINRFLELVGDVLEHLPPEGRINVVDFGCGRSYLTFALHHLLTAVERRSVQITGLDLKADVIADCQRISKKLRCQGLDFRKQDIAEFEPTGPVHLSVSLHACDTATDASIARSIQWNSNVILAVPCCQHEFAATMPKTIVPAIQKHGILHERFAALATDALRAEALEACGYKTQVVEFIDMEHTAKNLLIRAVRRDSSDEITSIQSYQELLRQLEIEQPYLERALGSDFSQRLNRDE